MGVLPWAVFKDADQRERALDEQLLADPDFQAARQDDHLTAMLGHIDGPWANAGLSKRDIIALQRSLNKFTHHYLAGVAALRVDGVKGHATNRRIMTVKYYLGYGKRDGKVTQEFIRRLRHPRGKKRYFPKANRYQMYRTGVSRRKRQRKDHRRITIKSVYTRGVTRYDGVPVAKVAVPILEWCRHNGWHGRLVSGWRDPRYSEHLCYAMCGAPRCSGMCAGTASNHVGNTPARFAIDVSDYYTFARVVARCPVQPRIYNRLPRDRVHFSPSGN